MPKVLSKLYFSFISKVYSLSEAGKITRGDEIRLIVIGVFDLFMASTVNVTSPLGTIFC